MHYKSPESPGKCLDWSGRYVLQSQQQQQQQQQQQHLLRLCMSTSSENRQDGFRSPWTGGPLRSSIMKRRCKIQRDGGVGTWPTLRSEAVAASLCLAMSGTTTAERVLKGVMLTRNDPTTVLGLALLSQGLGGWSDPLAFKGPPIFGVSSSLSLSLPRAVALSSLRFRIQALFQGRIHAGFPWLLKPFTSEKLDAKRLEKLPFCLHFHRTVLQGSFSWGWDQLLPAAGTTARAGFRQSHTVSTSFR